MTSRLTFGTSLHILIFHWYRYFNGNIKIRYIIDSWCWCPYLFVISLPWMTNWSYKKKKKMLCMIQLKIDYLLFFVLPMNLSLIWRRHHCRWRAAKFRSMLGAQGLWAGRDLNRATPAVTRGLGFSGLIQRTAPFCRLLRHTRGCGWSILHWILTGPLSVTFYDIQGDVEDLF
jgi:hypothetical protein